MPVKQRCPSALCAPKREERIAVVEQSVTVSLTRAET